MRLASTFGFQARSLSSRDTPGSIFSCAYYEKKCPLLTKGFCKVEGFGMKMKKSKDNLPWCGSLPSLCNEEMKVNNLRRKSSNYIASNLSINRNYFIEKKLYINFIF